MSTSEDVTSPTPKTEVELDSFAKSRLSHVRKSIFYGGMKGAIYGFVMGLSGSLIVSKYYPQQDILNVKYPKDHPTPHLVKQFITKRNNLLIFFTLSLTSVVSLIFSTVEGKNNVHFIQDIFSFNSQNKSAVRENFNELFSTDRFIRRQEAIEKIKEKRKRDEDDIKSRTY